jgi:hypothetical protein
MMNFRSPAAAAALAAALTTFGCTESVLSDVEITDPKLIRPTFLLSKEREGSSTTYYFTADLHDRKGDPVEIMNGGIYLNGIPMKVEHSVIGDLPSYSLSSSKIRFRFDSLYTFRVVLSDGSAYESSIRTQKFDLSSTAVKTANNVASITWTGDHAGPLTLNYTVYRDSIEIDRSMSYAPTKNPDTIRVSMEGMKNIRYTLETKVTGTANPAFRSGGSITSRVAVTR